MKRIAILLALALAAGISPSLAQAPEVSEKKDIAIFSLGYYGWNIPLEALGSIDSDIQKTFVSLGRFNIIGMTQKFSSSGVEQFIGAVRKAKEAGFTLPEKYQFGEAILTEAEFNRLLGAFIVAVPVVTSFASGWDAPNARWETEVKVDVTFLDVESGSTIDVARLDCSASDKTDQSKSVSAAIGGIASSLEFQIRSIDAFAIKTRVLAVTGSEVKIQLGSDMGIVKGDEYAITRTESLAGIKDERETGLILIKEVGSRISTGLVLYNEGKLGPDAQLKEIARMGSDLEPFISVVATGDGLVFEPGLGFALSRGFFGLRPLMQFGIPIGPSYSGLNPIPLKVSAGGRYDLHYGRLTLSPEAVLGTTIVFADEAGGATRKLANFGGKACIQASWLPSRDMRVFAEAGGEAWFGTPGWAGVGFGLGASFKF